MYLSNVYQRLEDHKKFIHCVNLKEANILVGNSSDPINNHFEIFQF